MAEAVLSYILNDINCLLSDLSLESLKDLHWLVLWMLLEIKHKEVLPRGLAIEEHAIFDPSDLSLTVMLSIKNELFCAFL